MKGDFLVIKVFRMLNRKVKPLVVPPGVRVHPHVQVILEVVHLDDHIEIATLKVRIELEFLALLIR